MENKNNETKMRNGKVDVHKLNVKDRVKDVNKNQRRQFEKHWTIQCDCTKDD